MCRRILRNKCCWSPMAEYLGDANRLPVRFHSSSRSGSVFAHRLGISHRLSPTATSPIISIVLYMSSRLAYECPRICHSVSAVCIPIRNRDGVSLSASMNPPHPKSMSRNVPGSVRDSHIFPKCMSP